MSRHRTPLFLKVSFLLFGLYMAAAVILQRWRLLLGAIWFPLGLWAGRFLYRRRWFRRRRLVFATICIAFIELAHWTTYGVDNLLGLNLIRRGEVDIYLPLVSPWFFYGGFWGRRGDIPWC